MTAPSHGRLADLPSGAHDPHPTAVAVFETLNRAGVRWCLLRGEARLQAPPHDVDLLVAEGDVETLTDAVRELGFVPVPTWARATHRFFVAHDPTAPEWFLLDVVTALSYGPAYAVETGWAELCLARREQVGSLWLLSADDAFWTLLLHLLLDRGEVPVHQQERVRRLAGAARPDTALARFTGDLCPPGWDAERVLSTARTQSAAAVLTLAPELSRRWASRHPLRFILRRLADTVRWRLVPLHTLIKMRGLRVVLRDEQGDLIEPVAAGLPGRFYLPVKVLGAGWAPPRLARPRLLPARRLVLQGWRALLAQYHQARGRLVVIPVPGALRATRKASAVASPWPRPDLVLDLSREGAAGGAPTAPGRGPADPRAAVVACTVQHGEEDLRRAQGLVLSTIWLAYARRRRWVSGDAFESRGARLVTPGTGDE